MAAAWIELLFYWEAEFRANAGARPVPILVPTYLALSFRIGAAEESLP